MRLIAVMGSTIALLIGCGERGLTPGRPLVPRARQSGEMIDISSIAGTVHGADGLRPRCPVYPHAEARMVIQGVTGTVQYQWERSDGTSGPLTELIAKRSPASGNSFVALRPDDWKDDQRGVQLTIDERVHVTYPFDFHSAPVTLNVKCF